MVNLLKETLELMVEYKLSPEQVIYVGDRESACSWEQFTQIANVSYDNGYGGHEILPALIIVFDNGMEFYRGEYDGSEWWNVHIPFNAKNLPPQKLLTNIKVY